MEKQRLSVKYTIGSAGADACDFLAAQTELSKGRIKDAMIKGAVWHRRKVGKRRRLRRATAVLVPGDTIELYYDAALLALQAPAPQLIDDRTRYSVWSKPAGLMSQGTDYGDHCSLERQAEIHFQFRRTIFLVHRLDREASGLMLLAHDADAAARLSALFHDNKIVKHYAVSVRGDLPQAQGAIDFPLDDKPAFTRYRVRGYDRAANVSLVDVTLETGRLHQIRRHFALLGYPVIGDPKYGSGNKNQEGMRLCAVRLEFACPFGGDARVYELRL